MMVIKQQIEDARKDIGSVLLLSIRIASVMHGVPNDRPHGKLVAHKETKTISRAMMYVGALILLNCILAMLLI